MPRDMKLFQTTITVRVPAGIVDAACEEAVERLEAASTLAREHFIAVMEGCVADIGAAFQGYTVTVGDK